MEKIDLKYRIPTVGKYNRSVFICPECNAELSSNKKHGSLFNHIIGFSRAYVGEVAIVECPECFCKWYYHSGIETPFSHYDYFLECVENGTQKHFSQ
jgi:hypothetical protein